MNIDEQTGEVLPGTDVVLVPLNLAGMDEDELLAMFPTPVQAAGALIYARQVARRAPAALAVYREKLKKAETHLKVQIGVAVATLADEFPRATLTERRILAYTVDRVKEAQDAVDTAWLEMEYARDFDRSIGRDIDILRSLNANLRGEHS